MSNHSRIHIETRGSGPALVLVHGWAMHGGIFAPLSERLAAHHTLHIVDLPGHGHSRTIAGEFNLDACATELLSQLPSAAWLGWSLGALIASRVAAKQAARITALIALAGSPKFVRCPDWPHAVEAQVFQTFADELGADYARTLDRFLALEAHGSEHMREELRELRAQVFARGEPDPRVLIEGLTMLAESDLRGSLSDLPMPGLWIAGRRDRLVPWQAMQAAAGSMPNGRFLRVEGAGHAPFLSHADEVATAILEFLRLSASSKVASETTSAH
ncbi:MAG: pimeloyl-ACP methyl ester esterase BioH [Pseudomarimonas sp.]